MTTKNIKEEIQQVQLCIDLIDLGARLQVLEVESNLSRGRLLKLYKEVRGVSPPKGMLPFSTDWFVTWLPNIHSSLFYNIYLRLREISSESRMANVVRAYQLYLEQLKIDDLEPVLSLTRAWTLLRFFESDLFQLAPCKTCKAKFIQHNHDLKDGFVCGICYPPSRAGKTGPH